MTDYRRTREPGSSWFFTVNLSERQDNPLLIERIDDLRRAFQYVQEKHPFKTDAVVVLPDHLHCIWTLPAGDSDFSTRWNLLKGHFSRAVVAQERVSQSRSKRRERGIWQRRFWEHLLRNDEDLQHHVDYIHWNPVKHGWVERVFGFGPIPVSTDMWQKASILRLGDTTARYRLTRANATYTPMLVCRIEM